MTGHTWRMCLELRGRNPSPGSSGRRGAAGKYHPLSVNEPVNYSVDLGWRGAAGGRADEGKEDEERPSLRAKMRENREAMEAKVAATRWGTSGAPVGHQAIGARVCVCVCVGRVSGGRCRARGVRERGGADGRGSFWGPGQGLWTGAPFLPPLCPIEA